MEISNMIPIIPLPHQLDGVKEPVLNLNDPFGKGIWRFLMEEATDLNHNIEKDFDFKQWDSKSWKPVIVPGELAMQGFDINNNTEYYYKRNLEIPRDWNQKRILIRFDGIYSNARVWLNHQYIGNHVGGFTSWNIDITEHIIEQGENMLVIGVADLEGDHQGFYNQDGLSKRRNSAWASYYAHHNIGGILRDVSLVAYDLDYIQNIKIDTKLNNTYDTANLMIKAKICTTSDTVNLNVRLLNQDRKEVISTDRPIITQQHGGTLVLDYELTIQDPSLWDSEHPNLYLLQTTLLIDDNVVQINEENIGLREILYGGQKETDTNKIYVNGKPVKLRGVCRHDLSYKRGRSITRDEAFKEIEGYKKCNINFIRTTHYPASKDILDACDHFGIYVEQENAACFQGDNGYEIYCDPEEFLIQFKEIVERDYNRTSIIIWSLGNESGFEKTAGFRWAYEYIKNEDLSRPVVFSYPYTVDSFPLPYDIISKHYERVDGYLGNVDLPVLHDEFAHVPCYNLEELKRDPNVRSFWGKSIAIGWDNIIKTDGSLGCAIWCANDDIFFLPEQIPERFQKHSEGIASGYGPWGCIFDPFLRFKPEAYMVKKAFSPVRIIAKDGECLAYHKDLIISIENRFDHTNLNELTLHYIIDGGKKYSIQLPDIKPHKKGHIVLPEVLKGTKYVHLQFVDQYKNCVEEEKLLLKGSEEEKNFLKVLEEGKIDSLSEIKVEKEIPSYTETEEEIFVFGTDFSIIFNKKIGGIEKVLYKDQLIITGGPFFHSSQTYLKGWLEGTAKCFVYSEQNYVVVSIRGIYEQSIKVQFFIKIFGDGRVQTSYIILDAPAQNVGLSEVGIAFDLNEGIDKIQWERKGEYSVYPQGHLGRDKGYTYLNSNSGKNYGEKPEGNWENDSYDYYLYSKEDKNQGLAKRDFKSMKENIYFYGLHFSDSNNQLYVESKGEVAVRIHKEIRPLRIDHLDTRISYQGAWEILEETEMFFTNIRYTEEIGASLEFDIEGTGFTIIGKKDSTTGTIKIEVDEFIEEEINTFSDLGFSMDEQVLYSYFDLPEGHHHIKVTFTEGTCIKVDGFYIIAEKGRLEKEFTRLIINNQWSYQQLGWGNYCGSAGKISKGTSGCAVIKMTDTKE